MTDMTDEELIGYARIHCTTERALFHKDHIVRLLKMGGAKEAAEKCAAGPEFINVWEDTMDVIMAAIDEQKNKPSAQIIPFKPRVQDVTTAPSS